MHPLPHPLSPPPRAPPLLLPPPGARPYSLAQFYDFDTGEQTFEIEPGVTLAAQAEAAQMGPQATYVEPRWVRAPEVGPFATRTVSELGEFKNWLDAGLLPENPGEQGNPISGTMTTEQTLDQFTAGVGGWRDWKGKIFSGTMYGVGEDNPANPLSLDELQKNRSLLVMFEDTSYFQVRRTPSKPSRPLSVSTVMAMDMAGHVFICSCKRA